MKLMYAHSLATHIGDLASDAVLKEPDQVMVHVALEWTAVSQHHAFVLGKEDLAVDVKVFFAQAKSVKFELFPSSNDTKVLEPHVVVGAQCPKG